MSAGAGDPTPVGQAPLLRFYGGKGGVGKTTCAAACALSLAEAGRRVLVVSTDPAHSLADAFERPLTGSARRVPTGRGRLEAVLLDADRALERWLDRRSPLLRTLALRGTYLDEQDVDRFFALALPGVDELVGLVELLRLVRAGDYDEVVVDTAPTGHTLRLLAMPETLRRMAAVLDDMQAKHRTITEALAGAAARDACDALIEEIDAQGAELMALLRDPSRSRFTLVLLLEEVTLCETRDALAALSEVGIPVAELVVNQRTPRPRRPCPVCSDRWAAEERALAALRAWAGRLPVHVVAAAADEPRGLPALRRFARPLARPARPLAPWAGGSARAGRPVALPRSRTPEPGELRLEATPSLRLLLFAGKGGVGKTTCAAAAALALAGPDEARRLLLLSTDPAHSLADVLATPVGDVPGPVPGAPAGLHARELDAARAFALRRDRYQEAVDDFFDALRGGSSLDAVYDRAIVRDLIDLSPPGMDELFAILEITDLLFAEGAAPPYDLVVVDSAPTGHFLRLLQMPGAALDWVRALLAVLRKYEGALELPRVAGDLLALARGLRRLRAALEDPARARLVVVTRPGVLPGAETVRLVDGAKRLGLAISATLLNAVVPAAAERWGCPTCRRAAAAGATSLAALERALGAPWQRGGRGGAGSRRDGRRGPRGSGCGILLAPVVAPPPRGLTALRRFVRSWRRPGAEPELNREPIRES